MIVQSLCGHASPVESLTFDSSEALVLAGASTGVIKLWDLEETKSKLIRFSLCQYNLSPGLNAVLHGSISVN